MYIMKMQFKKFLLVFVICIIIIYMADPVWGNLPKAQDNPQKIEERIAEMIAQHESDPNSHMGENESIDIHRKNEIIDHPARSVVADKFSNSSNFINVDVTNILSGYNDECDVASDTMFLTASQNSGHSGQGSYEFYSVLPYDFGYNDWDMIVDFIIQGLYLSGTAEAEFYFSFGKIQLKNGYYRIGYYTTSWQYTSWVSIGTAYYLRFRFFYSVIDETLYVFHRDNQVFSISYFPSLEYDELKMILKINRGSASSASVSLGSVKWYFDGI